MALQTKSMREYAIGEVKTISITESMEGLAKTLLQGNIFSTVFVIDSERHLHGIITRGDFLRKLNRDEYKDVPSLVNRNHAKIENMFGGGGYSNRQTKYLIRT